MHRTPSIHLGKRRRWQQQPWVSKGRQSSREVGSTTIDLIEQQQAAGSIKDNSKNGTAVNLSLSIPQSRHIRRPPLNLVVWKRTPRNRNNNIRHTTFIPSDIAFIADCRLQRRRRSKVSSEDTGHRHRHRHRHRRTQISNIRI
jgi:hypothetical protein